MSETTTKSNAQDYKYLDIILAFFVVVNITPSIATIKITEVFGWVITGGAYLAPLVFILIGLITEVYGPKIAKRFAYIGLGSTWVSICLLQIVGWLPASPQAANNEAYQIIAGASFRILLAATATFIVTAYSRILLTVVFEKFLKIKSFAVRNYIILFLNEAINQIVFITVAFWGVLPDSLFWQTMWQGYIVLVLVEIIVGLFLPHLANWLKQKEAAATEN